jgi:phosphonate transport system substrate-binding protein
MDSARFNPSRRRHLLASLAALAPPVLLAANESAVRIGLTPVFLDNLASFLARWRRWFEKKLDLPVSFIQRGNYREVVDLLRSGKIDFAWICGYPYVRHRQELTLIGVPLWKGRPTYRSYLIVRSKAHGLRELRDLRGRVFAYSDPDSNSGFLYPQYSLLSSGENPARFFGRTFFTWSHRNVVESVAVGLADGGAVDSYVWETLAELHPDLVQATRIIERSPEFGHTPFVARARIDAALYAPFRDILLGMASDSEGAALLRELRLDGFVGAEPRLYDGIERMARLLRDGNSR